MIYQISGQPRGMYLATFEGWWGPDAMITGAPAEFGDFNVTVTATDADGLSTTNTFPLRVSRLLQRGDSFKRLDLIDGTLDVPYSKKLILAGGVLRIQSAWCPANSRRASFLIQRRSW